MGYIARVRKSAAGLSGASEAPQQYSTTRADNDVNEDIEESIVVLGDDSTQQKKTGRPRTSTQPKAKTPRTRRDSPQTSISRQQLSNINVSSPTGRKRRRSTSVVPDSEPEAPESSKALRLQRYVEARLQSRSHAPGAEVKRKTIHHGYSHPVPHAKKLRLEDTNTITVLQHLPTPVEDKDVPSAILDDRPESSSSLSDLSTSPALFPLSPCKHAHVQLTQKPTELNEVGHIAQKQVEAELVQLRNRLSLAETALDQARQDCCQERLARQGTEKELLQVREDRDRERMARQTAEKDQALAEKARSEDNAAAESRVLELMDRVDGLEETLCDREALLERHTYNKEAFALLASAHDIAQAELKKELADCVEHQKATDGKLLTLQEQLHESELRCQNAVCRADQLQHEHNETVAMLQARCQEANAQLSEANAKYDTAANESTAARNELDNAMAKLKDKEKHHEAAIKRAEKLASDLCLSEAQRLELQKASIDNSSRLTSQVTELKTQLQDMEQSYITAIARSEELQRDLDLSEKSRLAAEERIEAARADTEKRLHEIEEKYASLVRQTGILQVEFAQHEEASIVKVENLEKQLQDAEERHMHAKEAQLRAEEGQLRAVKQLDAAQSQLADARGWQYESARMAETLEKEVARLTRERAQAVKARDDARVMASFNARELREEIGELKRRYRKQEAAVRAVATELLVDARTRFTVYRDLMGLARLRPNCSDGWTYWKGLPDGVKDAELARALGPLNLGWLRLTMSLLKEAEYIAKYWHISATTWQSTAQQQSQLRALREEELRRAMAEKSQGPAIYSTHVPEPQRVQMSSAPQRPPQPHGGHFPSPQQGFSPAQTPTVPQGFSAQGFVRPEGPQPQMSAPQAFTSQGFTPQGYPPQGFPPASGPPPPQTHGQARRF